MKHPRIFRMSINLFIALALVILAGKQVHAEGAPTGFLVEDNGDLTVILFVLDNTFSSSEVTTMESSLRLLAGSISTSAKITFFSNSTLASMGYDDLVKLDAYIRSSGMRYVYVATGKISDEFLGQAVRFDATLRSEMNIKLGSILTSKYAAMYPQIFIGGLGLLDSLF